MSEEIRNRKKQLISELGIKKHNITIGFVGRITEEKGVFELFEAYKRLMELKYDVGLVLCGLMDIKSERNRALFDEILKLDGVQYFGQVDNPLEYMVCCDIFVLPSWREGFGLVNIEANSVGVPVITTDIIGCKDSIENGKTGILVESKNKDELIKALEYLIKNTQKRIDMGQNGIKRVEMLYDRNAIWDELLNEYNKMVKEVEI